MNTNFDNKYQPTDNKDMNTQINDDWFTGEQTVAENKTKKLIYLVVFAILTLVSLLPVASHAKDKALNGLFNAPKSKFLKVDEAFQTIPKQKGSQFVVDFIVTPKHYVYKDRINVALPSGKLIKPLTFNLKPDQVVDPDFGKVNVFQKNVKLSFSIPNVKNGSKLTLQWQGCAKAGLCYPPVKETITVKKKR